MSPPDESALRTRVMIAYALCSVAVSEVHAGELEAAGETVRGIRGIIGEINAALDVQTVSASTVRELAEFSRELEHTTRNIEAAIQLQN